MSWEQPPLGLMTFEEAVAWMRAHPERQPFRCAFCGKTQEQVKQLIAGPCAYICDECAELCHAILVEQNAHQPSGA